MKKRRFITLLAALVLSLGLVALSIGVLGGSAVAAPQEADVGGPSPEALTEQSPVTDGEAPEAAPKYSHRLIVELASPSLAAWSAETGVARSANGRLDVNSPAAQNYIAQLEAEQAVFVSAMQSALPNAAVSTYINELGANVENAYQIVFNGVAVDPGTTDLIAAQKALLQIDGVRMVYRDYAHQPDLYASLPLINAADAWNNPGIGGIENAGAGIKFASMDGGVHHDAPMFDGTGYSYPPGYPKGGLGDTANNNGKIIASRAYFRSWDPPAPGDENTWPGVAGTPHGTHTSSTAAGDIVTDATYAGTALPQLSGVAPKAWVMSYRVFYESVNSDGSFYNAEGIAALEDIVVDGPDVLNNSWGGGPGSTGGAFDPLDQALINAANSGIFISMSAGNAGPGNATTDHPSPDYINVAASSTSGTYASGKFFVSAPEPVTDTLQNIPFIRATFGAIIPAGQVFTYTYLAAANVGDGSNFEGCDPFPEGTFDGKAAVISRGACEFGLKVLNAENAGAEFVVVHNHSAGGEGLVSMAPGAVGNQVTISSIFIGHTNGLNVVQWQTDNPDSAEFTLDTIAFFAGNTPDVLASFSSRGPGMGGVLKPDIAAPGVNIMAQGYDPTATGEARHLGYGQVSGTSMAAPHVAGSAALLRQIHPEWSNAEIKSALMSTSKFIGVWNGDGTHAQPLDMGAGRLDLGDPEPASADLLGSNQVSPITSDASGMGMAEFNVATRELSYYVTLTVSDPLTITAAHIHTGTAGTNGGVLYPIFPFASSQHVTDTLEWSGSTVISDSHVDELLNGDLYYNVHSTDNPGGELRGQVAVSFKGASAANPIVLLDSPSLSFSEVMSGTSKTMTVTVRNLAPHSETFTLTSVVVEGSGFEYSGLTELEGVSFSPGSITMAPSGETGDTAQFAVTFDSTATSGPGDYQGYVVMDGEGHQAHLPAWARVTYQADADVLIIDNDFSELLGFPDYVGYYTEVLDNMGMTYEVFDIDLATMNNGFPAGGVLTPEMLDAYDAVIYFTGDNFYPNGTFTVPTPLVQADQDLLNEYAVNGGKLLAMGQDLSSVVDNGSFLYQSTLGGNYLQDSVSGFALPSLPVMAHDDAPPGFGGISLDLSGAGIATVNLLGTNEVPPVATTANGTASAGWDATSSELSYFVTLTVSDPLTITAAHIHTGTAGTNGGVLYPIFPFTATQLVTDTLSWSGSTVISTSHVDELLNGDLYYNVHSTDNPGGEVRGQVAVSVNGDGASNQFYIDEIGSTPNDDAYVPPDVVDSEYAAYTALLKYPGPYNMEDGTVAMGHRGQPTLENPGITFHGQVVYTSFGLEGVNNGLGGTSREELLATFLAWAMDDPDVTLEASTSYSDTTLTAIFQASLTSTIPGGEQGTMYRWDFGDGSPVLETTIDTSGHDYAACGTYTVMVEVTNAWGNKAVTETDIVVDVCAEEPVWDAYLPLITKD